MQGISQDNHYDLFIFNRHARFQLIMLLPLKIAKRLLIRSSHIYVHIRTLKGKVSCLGIFDSHTIVVDCDSDNIG